MTATKPMKGRRYYIENDDPVSLKEDGRWKIRVDLWLFGGWLNVFESSEWYRRKQDAHNNYRLIFFGEWEEVDDDSN